MNRNLNWLLSASFALGSVALVVPSVARAADEDNNTAKTSRNDQNVTDNQQKAGSIQERTTGATPLQLPAGATQSNNPSNAAKLSGPIVGATNKALSKNGLDNMVGYFVDQDRDRLKDIDKINADQLNGRIDQINKAYQDKYNQKLDLDDRDFSANQSVEGEIQDPAQFAQNWPLPLMSGMEGQTASAQQNPNAEKNANANNAQPAANTELSDQKNSNIEKGRNVAIVRLPAENGMPAMDVSLISEAGGWKIDVPNNRSAQQIHDDVLKHLTMVGDDTSKWPSDALQARRDIARHVLMGIYGVDMPQKQAQ